MDTTKPVDNTLVQLTDVALGYGRFTVLRAVNLRVNTGHFWCIVGRNGEGKTTLINSILGMLNPSGGSVSLAPSLSDKKNIGFVPHRCVLSPTISTTVREFVSLGLINHRCRKTERSERLNWALDQMGLFKKIKDNYWTLSSGQRQRALIARALIRRPKLMILDEPTTGLDFSVEHSLLECLRELNTRHGLAIILVTHDLEVALHYSSHLAVLYDGNVHAGPTAEISSQDHLIKVFGEKRLSQVRVTSKEAVS